MAGLELRMLQFSKMQNIMHYLSWFVCVNESMSINVISHRIHVWYIYMIIYIYTYMYIWLIPMVLKCIGKYNIHESYGYVMTPMNQLVFLVSPPSESPHSLPKPSRRQCFGLRAFGPLRAETLKTIGGEGSHLLGGSSQLGYVVNNHR